MHLGYYGYKEIIYIHQPPVNLTPMANPEENNKYESLKNYNNWKLVNDVSNSYILSDLTKSLCTTYFRIETTKEMLDRLERKFGRKSDAHIKHLLKSSYKAFINSEQIGMEDGDDVMET